MKQEVINGISTVVSNLAAQVAQLRNENAALRTTLASLEEKIVQANVRIEQLSREDVVAQDMITEIIKSYVEPAITPPTPGAGGQ